MYYWKASEDFNPSGKTEMGRAILELVHSDLCGPLNPTSNGNKIYFVSFIDDFSRKTLKHLAHSKVSKLLLRMKLIRRLKHLEQIKEVNSVQMNLLHIVNPMPLRDT